MSAQSAPWSRRRFLSRSLAAGVGIGLPVEGWVPRLEAQPPAAVLALEGVLVGRLGFAAEPSEPMDTLLYDGLDGRLYTDLSLLESSSLKLPPTSFFIRTRAPDRLDLSSRWAIDVEGRVRKTLSLAGDELKERASPVGEVLMECAGNSREFRFGLLSSGDWSGVSFTEILEQCGALSDWVLVEGYDRHARSSTSSTAGCSWIFERRALEAAGAFLATHLADEPLSRDHGAPVRLVVPGWYGCCCVKWVQRIALVEDGRAATTQMKEFALRTHQGRVPELAAEYQPATIERSALPIRVEKWRLDGAVRYRVVGLDWGGDRSRGELQIRFRPDAPWLAVSQPAERLASRRWELWTHDWTPTQTGPYLLQLRVLDAGGPTPRLDGAHFARGVLVDDV